MLIVSAGYYDVDWYQLAESEVVALSGAGVCITQAGPRSRHPTPALQLYSLHTTHFSSHRTLSLATTSGQSASSRQ